MELATLIGVGIAFTSMVTMIILEGSTVSSILLPAPMILVFGASIAVGIASGTLRDSIHALKQLPKAFVGKVVQPAAEIPEVVRLSGIARKDGLLALEAESQKTDDPFVRDALQGLADGRDAEDLRTVLEERISTKARQDETAYNWYTAVGGYAPTIGIVGTVISLIHVLGNLEDPSNLGHMIAAAFVATLWGIASANFIWLPIGAKLKRLSDLEIERMEMLMAGFMAIQTGAGDRQVGERLSAMVPDKALPAERKAA